MKDMSGRMKKAVFAALALLTLGACLMSPGKFVSTLDIRADRSFTFAYKGEVIVTDMDDMSKGLGESGGKEGGDGEEGGDATDEGQTSAYYRPIALSDGEAPPADAAPAGEDKPESAEKLTKMREIADALSKEEGYRSVRYCPASAPMAQI
ncbi:hypothetical protein GCM10007897_40930 [Sphingobium jiangsuense]|nr:hypothetical protein [Sphingobium jiangsuense]GLT02672.1 hypothetical protein GCM10007897_40930 [Sphingobium jiangsuense]